MKKTTITVIPAEFEIFYERFLAHFIDIVCAKLPNKKMPAEYIGLSGKISPNIWSGYKELALSIFGGEIQVPKYFYDMRSHLKKNPDRGVNADALIKALEHMNITLSEDTQEELKAFSEKFQDRSLCLKKKAELLFEQLIEESPPPVQQGKENQNARYSMLLGEYAGTQTQNLMTDHCVLTLQENNAGSEFRVIGRIKVIFEPDDYYPQQRFEEFYVYGHLIDGEYLNLIYENIERGKKQNGVIHLRLSSGGDLLTGDYIGHHHPIPKKRRRKRAEGEEDRNLAEGTMILIKIPRK